VKLPVVVKLNIYLVYNGKGCPEWAAFFYDGSGNTG
jgi:hypothetical protein